MYDSCMLLWDLGVEACASWVQAVGSVAAIYVGARAIRWQVRQQERMASAAKLLADIDALMAHRALVKHAEALLVAAHAATVDPITYRNFLLVQWAEYETALFCATLNEVEMREIPDPGMKLAFRSARAAFIEADAVIHGGWQSAPHNGWGDAFAGAHRTRLLRFSEKITQNRIAFDRRIAEWQKRV